MSASLRSFVIEMNLPLLIQTVERSLSLVPRSAADRHELINELARMREALAVYQAEVKAEVEAHISAQAWNLVSRDYVVVLAEWLRDGATERFPGEWDMVKRFVE